MYLLGTSVTLLDRNILVDGWKDSWWCGAMYLPTQFSPIILPPHEAAAAIGLVAP